MSRKPKFPKRWIDAQRTGAARYRPDYPCRRGHRSERYASTGACVACVREDRKGKYKDKRSEYGKKYRKRVRAVAAEARQQRAAP